MLRALLLVAAALSPLPAIAAPAVNTPISPLKQLRSQPGTDSENQLTLLLVSRADCPYCDFVREEVLTPLLRSDIFGTQLRIRELKIDQEQTVTDAKGIQLSNRAFSQRYKATFTPTLLLLDNKGSSLAKPVVGVANRDMYSFYVERNIRNALHDQ